MKTSKYLLLTYFLPFFLILSCSKNDSDPLVGTWIYSKSFNPYENYNVREGFEVIYTEEIRMTIREDYTGVWDYDLISSDSTELSSNEVVIIPVITSDSINSSLHNIGGTLLLSLEELENLHNNPFVFDKEFSFELKIEDEFFTLIHEKGMEEYTYELYDDLLVLYYKPSSFFVTSSFIEFTTVFRKE